MGEQERKFVTLYSLHKDAQMSNFGDCRTALVMGSPAQSQSVHLVQTDQEENG